jgi:hypothetical protein
MMRRRFSASGGPMRTAKTPAFSSGWPVIAAQSPAAKISGSVSLCSVSVTRMKPASSSARPVSLSQAAPPAWVTQTISSASSVVPSRACRRPAATWMTSALQRTLTPRAAARLRRRGARRRCASAGFRLGRKQVEAQFVGVAPQRQFPAQAVLHGQRQFHAGGAGADHGDGGGAGVGAHALEQCQPAFVEAADRLHRHRVFGGARHLAELRCRADVDRERRRS